MSEPYPSDVPLCSDAVIVAVSPQRRRRRRFVYERHDAGVQFREQELTETDDGRLWRTVGTDLFSAVSIRERGDGLDAVEGTD